MINQLKSYRNGVHGEFFLKVAAELERLQKDNDELSQNSCGDCTDGWKYNRVEGRHACTCMTEMEPFQMLQTALEEIANGKHTAEQMPAIACEALISVLKLGCTDADLEAEEKYDAELSADNQLLQS